MRERRVSKPKFMGGRESAIEGASAVERGGRIALTEREGSKRVDMLIGIIEIALKRLFDLCRRRRRFGSGYWQCLHALNVDSNKRRVALRTTNSE